MEALSKAIVVTFLKGKNRVRKKQAHSWLPGSKLKVQRILGLEYLVVVHPVEPENIGLLGKIIRKAKPEDKTYFVPHGYGKLRRATDRIAYSWERYLEMDEDDRRFFREAKAKMENFSSLSSEERYHLLKDIREREERYDRSRTRKRRTVRRLLAGVASLRDKTGRQNRPAMAMKLLHIDPHLEQQLRSDEISEVANGHRTDFFVELTAYINQQLEKIYQICWSSDWPILLELLVAELDGLPFDPFCYAVAVTKNEIRDGRFDPERTVRYFEAELALMDYDDALSELRDKHITLDQLSFSRILADLHAIDTGIYQQLAVWIAAQHEKGIESKEVIAEVKKRLHGRISLDDPSTWDWLDAEILESFTFETGKLLLK